MTHSEIFQADIFMLLRKNHQDRISALQKMEESKKARKSELNPFNWHEIYRELLSDFYTDGFIEPTPFGRIIRQAERSCYFRGENQIYPTTKPSLCRRLEKITNPEQNRVERFVADLRLAVFKKLVQQFDHIEEYSRIGIDILYDHLAQHYNLETNYLDLTSDFEIALFFACCTYDPNIQQWRPLKNEDFNEDKKKYGVIFRKPYWRNNSEYFFGEGGPPRNSIHPIGFQPFQRCHMQSGYAMKMDIGEDLQQDTSFEKFKFRHSEKLSALVYQNLDGGKKVYPHEGLNRMQSTINKIKNLKSFNFEIFDLVAKNWNLSAYSSLISELNFYGYKISGSSTFEWDTNLLDQVNALYKGFSIEKEYGITLQQRFVYQNPELE